MHRKPNSVNSDPVLLRGLGNTRPLHQNGGPRCGSSGLSKVTRHCRGPRKIANTASLPSNYICRKTVSETLSEETFCKSGLLTSPRPLSSAVDGSLHSLDVYLMSNYCVSRPVPSAEATTMKRIKRKDTCLHRAQL